MSNLTPTQLNIIKRNTERLRELNDLQITLFALAEIIESMDSLPVGRRIPLLTTLKERAGIQP